MSRGFVRPLASNPIWWGGGNQTRIVLQEHLGWEMLCWVLCTHLCLAFGGCSVLGMSCSGILSAGDTEPILACFCLTAPRWPENTKPHRQRPENPDCPIAFALELHMGA